MTDRFYDRPPATSLRRARRALGLVSIVTAIAGVFSLLLVVTAPAHITILPSSAKRASEIAQALGIGTSSATAIYGALIAAISILALIGLAQLRAVIDSVGVGEAFKRSNAVHFARMGWAVLGMCGPVLLLDALEKFGAGQAERLLTAFAAATVAEGYPIMLVAFLLFILSSVFNEGAALHDDLEGTV